MFELLDHPCSNPIIAQLLIPTIEWRELDAIDASITNWYRISSVLLEVSVPFTTPLECFVVYFAGPRDIVAGPSKGGHQRPLFGNHFAPIRVIAIDAGCRRAQPGQQRRARRITNRRSAITAREAHPH